MKSLRAELSALGSDEEDVGEEDVVEETASPPKLALVEPRTGPTPKRKASNATAVSRTNPDDKLRHKSGHRVHLVQRAQNAVDPKHRVINGLEGRDGDRQRSRRAADFDRPGAIRRSCRPRGRRRCRLRQPGQLRQARVYEGRRADPAAARRPAPSRRGRPRPDASTARDGTSRSVARRTPKARSQSSSVTGRAAREATAPAEPSCSCWPQPPQSTSKRLLNAQQARNDDQTDDRGTQHAAIIGLLALLGRCLTELGDLTATESSTGPRSTWPTLVSQARWRYPFRFVTRPSARSPRPAPVSWAPQPPSARARPSRPTRPTASRKRSPCSPPIALAAMSAAVIIIRSSAIVVLLASSNSGKRSTSIDATVVG